MPKNIMRYIDFVEFYNTASSELDEAERMEGFLVEMRQEIPITRGEYVQSSINHLREAMENLDSIRPQLTKNIDGLEARYQKLIERDRELYKKLIRGFRINLDVAISLLETARRQYFFFRGKTEEGYPHEQLICDLLFRIEHTAGRLQCTEAFAKLRLNIGLIKDDLEQVLQRDKKFSEVTGLN